MEFRILGPLEVVEDERALPLGGARQRAVLALLLTRRTRSCRQIVSWRTSGAPTTADRRQHRSAIRVPASEAARSRSHIHSPARLRASGGAGRARPRPLRSARQAGRCGGVTRGVHAVEGGTACRPRVRALRAVGDRPSSGSSCRGTGEAHRRRSRARTRRRVGRRAREPDRRASAPRAISRPADACLVPLGRQAEALAAYRAGRSALVEELGIEPSSALQELERAILRQDPSLESRRTQIAASSKRSILVAPFESGGLAALLALAEPLAEQPRRELILVGLLPSDQDPAEVTADLASRREELGRRGVDARVAAYRSASRGADVALLATEQDVDLVLVDAAPSLLDHGTPDGDLESLLVAAPCDVGLLVSPGVSGRQAAGPSSSLSAASSTIGRQSRSPPGSHARSA